MAVRFADSFDMYQSADITKHWTSMAAWEPEIVTGGRYGNCMKFDGAYPAVTKTLDNQGTWIVGFAFKYSGLPTSDRRILLFRDGDSDRTQCGLGFRNDGTIAFYRADGAAPTSTRLATSSTVLNADTWYFIEVKVTIADAGTYQVRVNGVDAIASAAGDTKNSDATNNSANVITFSYLDAGQTYWIDDLYICDGVDSGVAATPNNDFLGDVRVEALFPSGAGSTTQWTPSAGSNYACVDEAATDFPNEDTDYVSSSTATNKDTYAMDDLDYTSGTVYAVLLHSCAQKEDATVTRKLQNHVVSGASTASGTATALSANSYSYVTDVKEADPQGGAAWTITRVNAIESGFILDT